MILFINLILNLLTYALPPLCYSIPCFFTFITLQTWNNFENSYNRSQEKAAAAAAAAAGIHFHVKLLQLPCKSVAISFPKLRPSSSSSVSHRKLAWAACTWLKNHVILLLLHQKKLLYPQKIVITYLIFQIFHELITILEVEIVEI